jgi:hypothetical protein
MKNLKLLIIATITVLFVASCQRINKEEDLTSSDKQEIVQMTLELALISQEIPDYELLAASGNEIVMSTQLIESVDIGEIDGYKLILLSPEQIQAKANSEGDFLYLSFSSIEPVSPDKVAVSFGSGWAVAEDSDTGYLSGGGFELEYTRTSSGWTSDIVAVWIS